VEAHILRLRLRYYAQITLSHIFTERLRATVATSALNKRMGEVKPMWPMDEKTYLRLYDQEIRAAMRAARGNGPGKSITPAKRNRIRDLFGFFAAAVLSMVTGLHFRPRSAR
jgi:hypothetical protein